MKTELRSFDFEVRAEQDEEHGHFLTGRPIVFGQRTDLGWLRRGIQDASCVGPGKSNLPLELRRKAGHCSRVTAGPIDLI